MTTTPASTTSTPDEKMRQIAPLFDAPREQATPTELASLHTYPWFDDLVAYFDGYPVHALTKPACRAYMYELVRALKPRFAVEIGTYRAGTTEVMARALHGNGGGVLVTIDPYGGDRVPGILESWPESLTSLVNFLPVNSMELSIQLERLATTIDLAFIDGNHAYAFAYFDLAATAKWVAPGGVVVLDDYDQPGVFWAAKHFLDAHADWQEISGVFEGLDPGAPFETMRPTIPDTKFLILQRMPKLRLGNGTPLSFDIPQLEAAGMAGIGVTVDATCAGTLHAKVFLRSFFLDDTKGDPEQMQTVVATTVAAGSQVVTAAFHASLFNTHPLNMTRREVEIILIWQPEIEHAALTLNAPPHHIPAN
jgi:predicted O-methyltransferase YrrM